MKKVAAGILGVFVLLAAGAIASAWEGFGGRATGARRARMQHSPEWHGGHFENPQPLDNDFRLSISAMFHASPYASPAPGALSSVKPSLAAPPKTGLRVTWLGHATTLVEIDGHRVLTDPMFGERASPVTWAGPHRWIPPPIALADLPPIDAVVISHDHYDHLDQATVTAMRGWSTTFIVPLGVAAHLITWGIPEARIVELDWWERTRVGTLQIVCAPARHASGRTGLDKDATLWAGYALLGPEHRVYYSGDTGLFPALKRVGATLGPFNLTMIEVGQYNRAWPDWHMGPEQAVTAHQWLRGSVFLPVHWGMFTLAPHGWTEPIERALAAAGAARVSVLAPRLGQSVEPLAPPPLERWWPALPWNTGAQDPVVSTRLDEP